MQQIESDIIIIGGGLTGLTLAYFLRNSGHSIHILEARNRLGGRIHTVGGENKAQQEMGATWLGKKHNTLLAILEELGVGIFEQKLGKYAIYEPISTSPPQLVQLPQNDEPSFRIKGGTITLIEALAAKLERTSIHTSQVIESIKEEGDRLLVNTKEIQFKAAKVVSTLPPYLLTKTINIQPNLPNELLKVMHQTHTWMGESIKVALCFKEPFWRANKSSGTIFSSVGPIPEMYDHTDVDEKHFALKGFLNGTYFSLSKEERLELILKQLRKYYASKVDDYISYEEMIWQKEAFTAVPYESHVLPHQNNGHPIYRVPYLNGKLFIAGTETAVQFPGYMDGAVGSAKEVAQKL